MSNLQFITKEFFTNIQCDFYQDNKNDIVMTREQIGQALEYTDPRIAIAKIHAKHLDRLDKFSSVTVLVTEAGKRETVVYNAKGVYEICRWSRQPKANEFMDWVWDIIEGLRTGKLRLKLGQEYEARIAR